MFAKNEQLMGRKIAYDGSSQSFGASHPRYVNYLERDGAAAKASTLAGPGSGITVHSSAHGVPAPGCNASTAPASQGVTLESDLEVAPTPFVFNLPRVSRAIAKALQESNARGSSSSGSKGTKVKKRAV